MKKISIVVTAMGALMLSSAAGYALSSNDTGPAKSLVIAQAGGGVGGGGAGGGTSGGGAGAGTSGGAGGGGAATRPSSGGGASTSGGGAGTSSGGAGAATTGGRAGNAGMSGGDRGDRGGMRGEVRGEREGMRGEGRRGADVNVRIRGERGYVRGGRGYGYAYGRRFHHGVRIGVGRCRVIVKRVFFRHHMVVKRIRRCF